MTERCDTPRHADVVQRLRQHGAQSGRYPTDFDPELMRDAADIIERAMQSETAAPVVPSAELPINAGAGLAKPETCHQPAGRDTGGSPAAPLGSCAPSATVALTPQEAATIAHLCDIGAGELARDQTPLEEAALEKLSAIADRTTPTDG